MKIKSREKFYEENVRRGGRGEGVSRSFYYSVMKTIYRRSEHDAWIETETRVSYNIIDPREFMGTHVHKTESLPDDEYIGNK